ncbi:hypothetical protein RHS01_05232 [Rhizoctonia solani]|uniref:Uncharacterized protein n=1 Tax=Rhizoctonia solani TaxID=456999 RepID=A0A8H7IBM1_9AGAM|nr:hypothetical protein RHS01_05232 [Rhizoctonia solani]
MSEERTAASSDNANSLLSEADSPVMALGRRPIERSHLDPGLLLGLELFQQDNDGLGFELTGTKASPIKFLGTVFHGKKEDTGPSFHFSNRDSNKVCSLTGGINLFGTDIGSVSLDYNASTSLFCGESHDSKLEFLWEPIAFELTKQDENYILRFAKIPAIFKDLIKAMEIAKKIEELSEADGSPCGVIKLVLPEGLSTEVKVEVTPEVIAGDTSKLQLDIKGSLEVTLLEKSVGDIEFGQITVTIDVSKPLDGLSSTLTRALTSTESVNKIVGDLLKNKAKLAEVIALVATEKLASKAVTTLICRDLYKPKLNEKDPPKDDQKEQTDDDGDQMGMEEPAMGERHKKTKGVDGPPPESGDSIGKAINIALRNDFKRWTQCTRIEDAIDSALACALEYRQAIALLRKILRSKNIVKNLGNSVYKDYTQRLSMLIYDFSTLSTDFAVQWLDMSEYQISMKASPSKHDGSTRKLEISWSRMVLKQNTGALVTVMIDDQPGPLTLKCVENTNTIVVDIPDYSRTKQLNITVIVSTAVLAQGGDPKYTFYSQGKPTVATIKEEPPTTAILNIKDYFPESISIPGDPMTYTAFCDNTPLVITGTYLHWPVKIQNPDNKSAWAFLSQNIEAPHEYKVSKQPGPIIPDLVDIKFDGEWPDTKVSLLSTEEKKLSIPLAELLRPELYLKYRHVLIARRDASFQPQLEGLSYIKSVPDIKQYPVILFGTATLWPVLFVDQRPCLSLQGYDGNKEHLITFGYNFVSSFSLPVDAKPKEPFVLITKIAINQDKTRSDEYEWVDVYGDSDKLLVKINTELWNTMDWQIDTGRKD